MSHLPATQMKVPRGPSGQNNLRPILRTQKRWWEIQVQWFFVESVGNMFDSLVPNHEEINLSDLGSQIHLGKLLAGKKPAKSQPGDVSEIFPKESNASGIPKLYGKWNTKPFAGSFWYILTNSSTAGNMFSIVSFLWLKELMQSVDSWQVSRSNVNGVIETPEEQERIRNTVEGRNPANQLRWVVYPVTSQVVRWISSINKFGVVWRRLCFLGKFIATKLPRECPKWWRLDAEWNAVEAWEVGALEP